MKRKTPSATIGDQVSQALMVPENGPRINSTLRLWKCRGGNLRSIEDLYDYVQPLGEGAYGTVAKWRVRGSPTTHPCVAVKNIQWQQIWRGSRRSKESEDAMRQELQTLLSLDHPNIAMFREWFEDNSAGIYFVMELCEGGSVQAILDHHICTDLDKEDRYRHEPCLRRYFRELLYAVSYIHSRNVVHRDLKPDNIMLKNQHMDSEIKLIDFGLATLAQCKSEGESWGKGTMVFMAPEMFLNASGTFTEKSDMWSMGVILSWFVTALEFGSTQHPVLDMEEGCSFEVRWQDIHGAFRNREPWIKEYFSHTKRPCTELAACLLVYEVNDRAPASTCLDKDWVLESGSGSLELFEAGGAIRNLTSWAKLDAFEKNVLSLLASNLNGSQKKALTSAFEALDTNKSGRLSKHDFLEGFRKSGVQFSTQDVDELFAHISDRGDGHIDYHDFVSATIGRQLLTCQETSDKVFLSLNASQSGKLKGLELSPVANSEETEKLFSTVEKRRQSRSLNQDEFREVVQRISKKRHTLSRDAFIPNVYS